MPFCSFSSLKSVRIAKQTLSLQQERVAAQQQVRVQQVPGVGFKLSGEETVLMLPPRAYPLTMTPEASKCLQQGLRIVHVLAQHLPKYLEVG